MQCSRPLKRCRFSHCMKNFVLFSRSNSLISDMRGLCMSTSQRSWWQNLAQGGASEASGTLGSRSYQSSEPASAGERICRPLERAGEFFSDCYPGQRYAPLRSASLAPGYTLPPTPSARWLVITDRVFALEFCAVWARTIFGSGDSGLGSIESEH